MHYAVVGMTVVFAIEMLACSAGAALAIWGRRKDMERRTW